ncbi:glycerophosphodiester phosphodiesterase [Pedobacter sp. KBW01]|nr:glycerophosphodiester phosphodiesterase [Pedobacter sp. KBW01]
MAKHFLFLSMIFFSGWFDQTPIRIHSHNDYTHNKPFYEAVQNKAFSIEADVFVVGDSLMVAHSKKEIKAGNTLDKMYLQPILAFSKTKDFYSFQLMIDFKESWDITYPVLLKTLKPYEKLFSKRGKRVSIVISGNRPPHNTFHLYPEMIKFDGLPGVNYALEDLKKITMISANFADYSKWKGIGEIPEADQDKLSALVLAAYQINKPFRFWGAPDNENYWKQSLSGIINTDKVTEATNYFKTK